MSNSESTDVYNPSSLYWTKNLLIGHSMIDADHRRVFDLANKLRAEFLEEPEHSIVGEVLVELIEHTGDHFLREEALMRAIRFPGYGQHKQEHTTLMHKVNDLHLRFMEGNGNLAVDVSKYLHEWLVPHIMNADVRLGRQLRGDR